MALNKDSARIILKRRRGKLSERDRAFAALKLGANIAAFFDAKHLPDTAVVGAYWAMADEIDPRPALASLISSGATVAFPCVHENRRMEFYHVPAQDLDREPLPPFLADPARSFPPSSCKGLRHIAPDELDVLLVPGLGFDRHKTRLGYGAGCYDRYLARIPERTLVVGIAFDQQLCDELECEEHDRKMDFLLTPNVLI